MTRAGYGDIFGAVALLDDTVTTLIPIKYTFDVMIRQGVRSEEAQKAKFPEK